MAGHRYLYFLFTTGDIFYEIIADLTISIAQNPVVFTYLICIMPLCIYIFMQYTLCMYIIILEQNKASDKCCAISSLSR